MGGHYARELSEDCSHEEIGASRRPQHVEMEGEVVGSVQAAVPSETSDVTNVERK
jgi:hypothetical protein